MSETNQHLNVTYPTTDYQQELTQTEQNQHQPELHLGADSLMFSMKPNGQVYEKIILEELEENNYQTLENNHQTLENNYQNLNQSQKNSNSHEQNWISYNSQENNQSMEDGQIKRGTDIHQIHQVQVKQYDDGYRENAAEYPIQNNSQPTLNNQIETEIPPIEHSQNASSIEITEPHPQIRPPTNPPSSHQTEALSVQKAETVPEIQLIQEEDKNNEMVERYESDTQYNEEPQHQTEECPPAEKPQQPTLPLPQNYNSYMQAVLNTPMNMSTEPTEEDLEFIHQTLKKEFPSYHPEQIYILLYNNLIKAPREALLETEAQQYNPSLKYDGGLKYWAEINSTLNHSNKYEMSSFELRKQMIKVYVTKGYGLKVFQEYIKSINPQAPEIDKEKFKKHFIEIYKITMRKVEDFLTNTADRHFEPLRKEEYQKPLSDVINCKKHYSAQFCEVFYRILQSTFDTNFDQVPNEQEVVFFYKTIIEKLRNTQLKMVKKLHQQEEEKDIDIWTKEFEETFIKIYISLKNLAHAKDKLISIYPECEAFITNEKLTKKIQHAIRTAIRYLAISNANCGNPVPFEPSDIDRKLIMTGKELEESRIKLLKVYLKRPIDSQVLQNIVSFIHKQLKSKYEIERVPAEVMRNLEARELPRGVEKSGLESLLKGQLIKNY